MESIKTNLRLIEGNEPPQHENSHQLTVDLAAFEGPLDLLLHLIRELEVDVFDIPIVAITEQYLNYIHSMKKLELDIASEYLVMAATLIEIKTTMMLPKAPQSEVEIAEDPRQDLVDQLIAYQQYQEVGHILAEKQNDRALSYSKEPANLSGYQETIPMQGQQLTTEDLYKALEKMISRLKEQQPFQTKIVGDRYSIEDAMGLIADTFMSEDKRILSFYEVLSEQILTRERVVTLFLAMLELAKTGKITFCQEEIGGEIELRWQGGQHEFSRGN